MGSILAERRNDLIDTAISITLRGFPPREPVNIKVTQSFADSLHWQASATFLSGDDGSVSVSEQAPLSGSYDGVSAMGLFWSLERVPGPSRPLGPGAIMQTLPVEIEAAGPAGSKARLVLERRIAGVGVVRQEIRRDGIVGTLFLPSGLGPHPAVLVVSGAAGNVIEEFRAAVLASHGYAALALAHSGFAGLPAALVDVALEYFHGAIAWMRRQPWLRDDLLAVWGASRGGELALLLGAMFPEINAVIAWVPSGVAFWAIGADRPLRAAWTFRNQPVAYLQENNSGHDPAPQAAPGIPVAYTPFYRSFLRDAAAVERATIPVERTRGPVLLVSGSDDQMWPSSDLADIALRRLEAHRHPFAFQHLKYEGAGHQILVPYWPTTNRAVALSVERFRGYLLSQGGSAKADAEAGVDAWARTLAFLADAQS